MTIIPITDLRVIVYQHDGRKERLAVDGSPYYHALNKGIEPFRAYMSILGRYSPKTYRAERGWRAFRRLAGRIDERGFDFSPPRVRLDTDGRTVLDGQHRMAILLYLHGPGLRCGFDNNELIKLHGTSQTHPL